VYSGFGNGLPNSRLAVTVADVKTACRGDARLGTRPDCENQRSCRSPSIAWVMRILRPVVAGAVGNQRAIGRPRTPKASMNIGT
jgi:hypothetical protein